MNNCRLCYCFLNENQEFCEHIFNHKLDPPIWKMMAELADLTILESDPYTKLVCFQCFDQLQQFYLFRKVVLYTDWRIRHYADHSNNNNDMDGLVENANNNLNDRPSIKTEKNGTDTENYIPKDNDDFNNPIINEQNETNTFQEFKDKVDVSVDGIDDNSQTIEDNHGNNNNNDAEQSRIDVNNSFDDCHEYCPPMDTENDDYNELVEEKIKVEDHIVKMENPTDYDSQISQDDFNFNQPSSNDDDDLVIIGDHNAPNSFESLTTCVLYSNENGCTEAESNKNQESINPGGSSTLTKTKIMKRMYMCNICGKKCSNKKDIKSHLKSHTAGKSGKSYKCHICNKQFPRETNLKAHLKVHTSEKSYECNYCYRKFTYQSNLTHHLRVHTGEKPYKCNICEKRFTRKSNLKVHFRMHTGEKPYKCNICDRQFAKKKSLNDHLELHQIVEVRT